MCAAYSFPWLQLTRAEIEVSEEAITVRHDSGECVACFAIAIPIWRAGGNNGL